MTTRALTRAPRSLQRVGTRVDFQVVAPPAGPAAAPPVPLVTNIYFGLRPVAHVTGAGGGQGDHSTAYDVFEWAIVNAFRNQTFANAVTNLATLTQQVRYLPGYYRGHPPVIAQREARVNAIVTDCANVLINPASVPDLNKSAKLGDLADQYLELRNSIHYTAFTAAAGGPGGHVVRQGAQDLAGFAPAHPLVAGGLLAHADLGVVTQAMWNIWDYRPTTAAGRAPAYAARVVAQMVRTVFQSYPNILPAWQDQIRDEIINDYLLHEGAQWGWNADGRDAFTEEVQTAA